MNMFIRLRTRKKSFIIVGVIVIVSLLSTYGILYMVTPYSGFARSIIWGDSDIKDYERFPFRTIENAPPVFQFSNLEFPDANNANPFLSSILLDNIIPNTSIYGYKEEIWNKNKIKTKAKTVNRNLGTRQQQVAMAKSIRTSLDIDRNRESDEAAPAATSDVETIPKAE